MELVPLTQDTEKAEEVASRYVRAIFVSKLLLSAVIIPIAIVALFESPYIFDAFRTEFRITPILRSVLIGSFYLAIGLFCLKAFAVYFPIFGPVCGVPIHSRLWHLTMFSVGLLFDAMVVTPRMFLGSAIDSLSPANSTSNHLFSRQTHALLLVLIVPFAAAFYLGWHPGYSDFVAKAREDRQAELASIEQWRATLDEKLSPLPETEPPIDPTPLETLLPPVKDQLAANTNSATPSEVTESPFQSESPAQANRTPPPSESTPARPNESAETTPPPPLQNPPETVPKTAPEPPQSIVESVEQPTTPPPTQQEPISEEPPNPFQKRTTWVGMSLIISDGGVNPTVNVGAKMRVELTITRHDADQFEGTIRFPWAVDAQGNRVKWGATASARGTYRDGQITIRSTPTHVPRGTVLFPATWKGTISEGFFTGESRGPNDSLNEFTLQKRSVQQRRSRTK